MIDNKSKEEYIKELAEQIDKGKIAEQVYNYVHETFDRLRQELFDKWRSKSPAEWQDIYYKLDALDNFENAIFRDIGNGVFAQKNLKEELNEYNN